MTDVNTLIRDLEAPPDGQERGTWIRVVQFAHEQGWYDDKRHDLNAYLVGRAFNLNEENILFAVAMSLVPEGWRVHALYWDSGESPCECILHHREDGIRVGGGFTYSTPAYALAIAAIKARLEGRV